MANQIESMAWKDLELEVPVIAADRLTEIAGGFDFGSADL